MKQLHDFGGYVNQFQPGTITTIVQKDETNWVIVAENYKYITYPRIITQTNNPLEKYYIPVCESLQNAVKKRVVETTERPVACLLSGGLDSSLVTALVNEHFPKGTLETYSIGLSGSTDLVYAQKVADYLGTKHTQVVLTEDDFFSAIPEVIRAIESYDVTTVRASVGNYLVSKYISEHSSAKVIFNGDGSDELTGGYLYFHNCPDDVSFDIECKRLLTDIHMYDVLRSDKSISSNGLEPRTAFLDSLFVQEYLSIPVKYRNHSNGDKKVEKCLLREAFEYCYPQILPKEILWRKKEAFSDGVSSVERSWYSIIKEKLVNEEEYYKKIFNEAYPQRDYVIPYKWMPRWVTNATDPSARTLKNY